jgi:hypothetical protein
MVPNNPPLSVFGTGRWRYYLELTKPKVSLLIVFTAVVGMVLASPGMVPLPALIFGTLGIGMASASAAAFNHVLDRHIDERMSRTRRRPLPTGHLLKSHAAIFAGLLGAGSMLVLWASVGMLTAALTFCSLIGYAMVYTLWLKHATPQNIVIGGAAGAAPPVLGWAAVTNTIDAHALLLLGAGDRPARRLRQSRHSHAAGDARHCLHAPANRSVYHSVDNVHAAAVSDRHERPDLPRKRARAQRPVHVLRAGVAQGRAGRPADAHIQVFHYLFDVAVRGIDRRSLPLDKGIGHLGARAN